MKEVPDPVYVMAPGVLVMVQLPVAGRPLNTTLPVGTVHVGWVTAPVTGAVGFECTVKGILFEQPSAVLV